MTKFLLTGLPLFIPFVLFSQENSVNPRPLTLDEYEKTKTFVIKNLDTDTYAKFENAYILDRYEMRKPYFITGDDGQKKRIDLYQLIAKEGKQELGLMIFYTTEKGKQFQVCLPDFTADVSVWKKYFEDVHAIDKEEKNFVLKLSYVLSKELGFQFYKSVNQGKDLSQESLTYGNDICFPGDQNVILMDGSIKPLSDISRGDQIMAYDPDHQRSMITEVEAVSVHEAKNYAIIRLTLVSARERMTRHGDEIALSQREIEATPNHPVKTMAGEKEIKAVMEGDKILCVDKQSHGYQPFVVLLKNEFAGGVQKVYNLVTRHNAQLVLNGVVIRQK